MLKKFIYSSFMVLLILFFSCNNSGQLYNVQFGTVNISFNDSSARTVIPNFDMNISSYIITGDGPGSATFTETITEDNLVLNNLLTGTWIISVEAKNANNQTVGESQGTVTVYSNITNTLNMEITPVLGTGTFNLTLNFPQDLSETSTIQAYLQSTDDTITSIDFTTLDSTATYSALLSTGYYKLYIEIIDNQDIVWGKFDTVRIIADQISQVSYTVPSGI